MIYYIRWPRYYRLLVAKTHPQRAKNKISELGKDGWTIQLLIISTNNLLQVIISYYLPRSKSKLPLYSVAVLILAQGGFAPQDPLHKNSSESESLSRNGELSCGIGHELTIFATGTCRLSGLSLAKSKGSITSDPVETGLGSSDRGDRGRSL